MGKLEFLKALGLKGRRLKVSDSSENNEYDWGRYRKPVGFLSLLAVVIVLAAWRAEVDLGMLWENAPRGFDQLGEHFPPDLGVVGTMLRESLITVAMALLATPLGGLLSLALGLAAAKNISPEPIRSVARGLISIERAMPEIVVLLFLIVVFGIGYFAGIMALAIGCIGMLGRLLADAIEEIDKKVVESVEVVGVSKSQLIRYAILPEVLPAFISNLIFRFEVNIRASVVLGAVGAGGIGYELGKAMDLSDYNQATTAILVIVGLVLISERISDALRKKVDAKSG
ncbi:MAG: phosphonate ABC transporter, permease protein PhnE, partial [Verrucomicrobiota bacterium]